MPPKNKKGKASKLARMSDEERARYLQHRADVELEAKRRKQQLIATFTKNKIKREEAFARINAAKINEQWRTTLRQIKCSDLHEDVKHLRKFFEETLIMKDGMIKKLYDELIEADVEHQRFQQSHMLALDTLIEQGEKKVDILTKIYEDMVAEIENQEIKEFKNLKNSMKEILFNLKTIVFAKQKYLKEKLDELQTKNAVSLYSVEFAKEESITNLKREIYPKMENLWQKLNDVITDYETSTATMREKYELLKEKDDIDQSEISQFPKMYEKLRETAETLRKNIIIVIQEKKEIIEDLSQQSELITKKVFHSRQQAKIEQTLDEVQLKQLSVSSSEAIKELEKILGKSIEILKLSKLCSDLKSDSFYIKKYSVKGFEKSQELEESCTGSKNEPYNFFKKIEGFRDHLYYIKEENDHMKQERNSLIEENNRLKHSLKSYLVTIARMPTIRPSTRA